MNEHRAQAPLNFDPPTRPVRRQGRSGRAERVIAYFEARPGEWISALDFQRFAGWLSSRTAISEARVILERNGRGSIDNQLRVVDGSKQSFYRYRPAQE